jgi:hypothetical protein
MQQFDIMKIVKQLYRYYSTFCYGDFSHISATDNGCFTSKTNTEVNSITVITVCVFQEERCAAAFDHSVRHDGDTVPEEIGLVHEVGGQNDGPARAVLLEDLPCLTSGCRIHTGCRLIQNYDLVKICFNTLNTIFNLCVR